MPALTDELLDRLRSRAAGYDAANAYPADDVAELAASGYLALLVPVELGGGGASLVEGLAAQRLLARYAPATALTVNMHQIWVGVAALLWQAGDTSLEWVLRDAVRGEFFAFGISEAGNGDVLFDSFTEAVADGDDWLVTGTKIFTTAAPAWTRLGVHARVAGQDRLVFGFVERDEAISVSDHWDPVGMRATQSRTTTLAHARITAAHFVRTIPVGPTTDALVLGIFACFELLIGAVYLGLGDRALELAVEAAKRPDREDVPRSQLPAVRRHIGEAALTIDGASAQLVAVAAAYSAGEPRGFGWFRALVGAKVASVRAARVSVDHALGVVGGGAFDQSSEISRLYRDVLAGDFHPSSPDKAVETIATNLLGPIAS